MDSTKKVKYLLLKKARFDREPENMASLAGKRNRSHSAFEERLAKSPISNNNAPCMMNPGDISGEAVFSLSLLSGCTTNESNNSTPFSPLENSKKLSVAQRNDEEDYDQFVDLELVELTNGLSINGFT